MSDRERIRKLQEQLAQAEGVIEALRSHQVDAIVGKDDVALVRLREAEDALRVSEDLNRRTLQALSAHIVVLDQQGRIIVVNEAWTKFARRNAAGDSATVAVGANYLEACRPAVAAHDPAAVAALAGIEAVLGGRQEQVTLEYPCHSPQEERWFLMTVVAFGAGGAVITHLNITARKQAEEKLHASLHEKEVLLKEIHHRVKNNLQVISSLISLQADNLADECQRDLFGDLRDRVRSMALVHEKLYETANLARIEFAEYVRHLLHYLWRAHGSVAAAVNLKLDLQPVWLSAETAVPCGLILNELATNALKHAFRGRADGEMMVALQRRKDGQVSLQVRDNGIGLPVGSDWRQSRSLGLQLVQMLSVQLHGTVAVRGDGGTEFEFVFEPPKPPS